MKLNYTIQGQGSPVLLLHPVGSALTFLEPLAELLSQNYQVMSMDLRGHGQSPRLSIEDENLMLLDDFAKDAHETLHHTQFSPCAVVGFSFGGMIAQSLAYLYPQDVSILIPCACPCTLPDANRKISAKRGTDAKQDGMTSVIQATMERWFTPAFRGKNGHLPSQEHLLSAHHGGWVHGWHAISNIDQLSRLPQIKQPTLCIAGEVDASSPPDVVGLIGKGILGAQLKIVKGAPHMLFIEQPQEVADLIHAFLKTHQF
ncbi:MAG: alpha/beta fold hydrolase [Limnohabitans sp.]|nr:alpha/beta fold hydrolase [Limnohabitans sp.]